MPTKIFTTIPGPCPFGYKNKIDDNLCRLCPYYFRTGTGTFFWCNHPVPQKAKSVRKKAQSVPTAPESGTQPKRKRGRPRKNAPNKPVKQTKKKNG